MPLPVGGQNSILPCPAAGRESELPLRRPALLRLPAAGDNAAMKAEPNRNRRWFQFRLRTLMIAVTLLAVRVRLRGLAGEDREGAEPHAASGRDC